jgi:hypothetical protein
MATVEELQQGLESCISPRGEPVYGEGDPWISIREQFATLIAAAEAQGIEKGKVEGAEQYRQQILGDTGTLVQEFGEQDVYVVRCEILDKPPALSPAPKEPEAKP